MENYKYSLAKKGKSICPECKQKTFVLYLDNTTGKPLHSTVGKCDRDNNCGHHYPPREYFKDKNIPFDRNIVSIPLKKSALEPQREPSFIDKDILNKSMFRGYDNNLFVQYLRRIIGDRATANVIARYHVGTSKNGGTIFWQRDTEFKVRTGKIIQYDKDGHRRKDISPPVQWVHKVLEKQGQLQDFHLSQCLFGEHAIPYDTTKAVAVVESEKTAIIASVFMPEYIWVACGGSEGLNLEKCKSLKGRKVILYPDAGMFEKWSAKAKELSKICTISASALIEEKTTDEERQKGFDLADYLVRLSPDFLAEQEPPDEGEQYTHYLLFDDTSRTPLFIV